VPAAASELASVPLFQSLSEPDLDEISSRFEAKEVGPGVRLVGEGTTGLAFFVISEGEAVVTAGGVEIASLGPGDFFGEMAMLGSGRRTATVTTTSPARVLVLFTAEFDRLRTEYPGVAAGIDAVMQSRR
jgi:CRP-like cAMP-binding protein